MTATSATWPAQPAAGASRPPPGRPPRPHTVTAAAALQAGAALLLLLVVVGLTIEAIRYDEVIARAGRNVAADAGTVSFERHASVVMIVVVGGVCLLLAVWFAALAVPVWRGSAVARIMTTVGAGLPLLCGLCMTGGMLLLIPLVFAFPEGPDPGPDPDDPELFPTPEEDRLYAEIERLDAEPLWQAIAEPVVGLLFFCVLVLMVTLLFVPPSNRYFRPKRRPTRHTLRVQYIPYPVYYPVPMPQRPDPPPDLGHTD